MIHPDITSRYRYMIGNTALCQPDPGTSLPHLVWMLEEIEKGSMPMDKQCRWLGFVQGILIERGYTDTQTERDFTRHYFTAQGDPS